VKTNELRRRRRFMTKLLMPYLYVAARTPDKEAAAAIRGLCQMLTHASNAMIDADMDRPMDPEDEAFLDAAIAALGDDDKLAALRTAREKK